MLEIIGVVVLVIIGAYLILAGVAGLSLILGFTGKFSGEALLMLLMIVAGISIEAWVFFVALDISISVGA